MAGKSAETTINLNRIAVEEMSIQIKGTTPLITHRWSEKAREMMLAAQQGRKAPKIAKDPQADYEASMYRLLDGGHGFPVMAFKSATVKGGARMFGTVAQTELRQMLTFMADGIGTDGTQLVRISGEPRMGEDMVRLNGKTADIRYRAYYDEWGAILRVRFVPAIISADSIVALIDAGGTNGVGEWRPEKNGSFGTYEVMG